ESNNAKSILGLKLRREQLQCFLNDSDAVCTLHRAGVIEDEYQIEGSACLAALRSSFDRETQQVSVLREWVPRAFPGKRHRHTGTGHRITIIKGINKFFAPDAGGSRHYPFFQTGSGELERDIAYIEGES